MERARTEDFYKRPGVAETIDWGMAMVALHEDHLTPEIVDALRPSISVLIPRRLALRGTGCPEIA